MKRLLFPGKKAVGTLAFLAVAAFAQAALADTTSTLLPVSDGAFVQWATSSGTTHYTLVDEATCNSDTDYTYANTVGKQDSYGVSIASIPNGATITSISATPCASRNANGSGSSTLNLFYVYNGIKSANGTGYALGGSIKPTTLAATSFRAR